MQIIYKLIAIVVVCLSDINHLILFSNRSKIEILNNSYTHFFLRKDNL